MQLHHLPWATRIGRGRNQRATASPPKKAPLKASAMRDKSEGLREELNAGATGQIGELDSGSAAAKVRAVSSRDGTEVETGAVQAAAEAGDAAAVANCLAIAIAASISIGEHVSPVAVGSARTSEGGASCATAGPVATTSERLAAAPSKPASCSYCSLATKATLARVASGAGVTGEGE